MNTTANANLFSRLFDTLDDPNRLAIEMLDGTRISYGDLIARAGQMANVLVARGVKPGDRVAAQTEKSVPALVLYLATVRAGAVYLPLNTAYTLNELDYFISDAEPSLVVCDPSKAEGIGTIAAKVNAKVETLGPDGKGVPALNCVGCHQTQNADSTGVPGGPDWHLAPLSMRWQDINDRPLSSAAVCRAVTDRSRNENMDGNALLKHHAEAALVLWAWNPGRRPDGTMRTLPPLTHDEFVAATRAWVEAGTPCPRAK